MKQVGCEPGPSCCGPTCLCWLQACSSEVDDVHMVRIPWLRVCPRCPLAVRFTSFGQACASCSGAAGTPACSKSSTAAAHTQAMTGARPTVVFARPISPSHRAGCCRLGGGALSPLRHSRSRVSGAAVSSAAAQSAHFPSPFPFLIASLPTCSATLLDSIVALQQGPGDCNKAKAKRRCSLVCSAASPRAAGCH